MASTRITLKHVSQAAGVSVQTASHILGSRYRSLYHPETRDKVLGIARQMGYRPNAAARSMIAKRSHIIGVLVPIQRSGWFFQLDVFETMLGMNERLSRAGYVTSVIPVGELQSGHGGSRAFEEQLVDGLVAIGWIPDDVAEFVQKVTPTIIWCDTNIDRPTGCLRRDEYHAGKLAATHAIGAGYRRLAWLTYDQPSAHYSSKARRGGIFDVAAEHGVPVDELRIGSPDLSKERAKVVASLTPDIAVITEHHHFAQAVLNLAVQQKLTPGVDFGLASCDHSKERASVFPDLSRVVLERYELGEKMADMLLANLKQGGEAPPSQVVQGRWFAGKTLRRPEDRS